MPLTDLQIRRAASANLAKLSDGGGLQLWVFPDGAKRWRLAYRFDGKQRVLALGVYPEVCLREAREAREAARKLLAGGVDPNRQRKLDTIIKAEARTNTFAAIAAEHLEKKRREGKAQATLEQIEWCYRTANEVIGPRPIGEVKPAEILALLKAVESRGRVHTARRLRAKIGEVFRYAIASGRAEIDPTVALAGALVEHKAKNFAAVTEEKPLGELLRAIDDYAGAPETRIALQLLALTFVRPGVLRAAEWAHFNLTDAVWTIPAEAMKMRRALAVPLAPQACMLLEKLRLITGKGKYLFPSIRSGLRPMSENTLNGALRRLGYAKDEATAHGFRSAAATLLNESGLWHADAIEAQMAHIVGGVRGVYVRGDYWPERVRMMAAWADTLDRLRAQA
jgi:integrase